MSIVHTRPTRACCSDWYFNSQIICFFWNYKNWHLTVDQTRAARVWSNLTVKTARAPRIYIWTWTLKIKSSVSTSLKLKLKLTSESRDSSNSLSAGARAGYASLRARRRPRCMVQCSVLTKLKHTQACAVRMDKMVWEKLKYAKIDARRPPRQAARRSARLPFKFNLARGAKLIVFGPNFNNF